LGTDSIYMAEYGQTGPPCTSIKYYITWLRFRRISGTVAGDFSRLIVKGRRKLRLERKQFGKPISDFQLVQAMLADSKAEIYAAKCMVLDAARKRDDGMNVNTEASCAKMFATEMCSRVADRCVQIHGGAGYVSEYAIERFYRDVRLFRIYEGTTQIQQIVIARNMIREAQG
jgi:alkylation response protein AidB-like acyl-CoA dehydrogenase